MIHLTSDFTYLTFFKFHKLLTYTNLYFHHDSEKTIRKKAPKRVEYSSVKKRTRSPPPPKKKKKEIKKRRKTTKISCPILHEKLRRRNERRRLKGRFSFGSVDFFTNILLIEIMIANPNRLRVLRKE